jgi:hypothetical protein
MFNPLKKVLWMVLLGLWATDVLAQVDTAWVRRYNGPGNGYDEASAIALDGEGNIYVTGSSYGVGMNYDYLTIKYYSNGDTAWVRRYNGPGNASDKAHAIAVLDTSGENFIYVTGGSTGSGSSMDYATIMYDSNGDTAWISRFNGLGNNYDEAKAVCVNTTSSNIYVAGTSTHAGGIFPYNLDYCTIKYSFSGDTVWTRSYNGLVDGPEDVGAMALDRFGNIYVTGGGSRDSSGLVYDFLTIKYYLNGDTAWVRKYNVPGGTTAEARAIAIDESLNVYVAGISAGGISGWDYTTVKYHIGGDTAWTRIYNGPANGSDLATAMAMDKSGNIYVTGSSESAGSGTPKDFVTVKYRPNGDTAWIRRYSEPGNGNDLANAIAVDDHDNVYVTGSTSDDGLPYDYLTLKYYPDGNLAWVRRYNGPGNYTDEPSAIVVDGSSNVYVTGTSNGSGTVSDYSTIKYAQYYMTDTLRVLAFSPVDLIVTDPQGDSIGIGFNTIPDATYDTTQDYNMDGDKDDIVTIPNRLVGTYLIRVVTEPGGSGTYDLGIRIDGGSTAMLAMNNPCPGPGEVDTFYYGAPEFKSGDATGDWNVDVGDVVYLINYLYKNSSPPNPLQAGDANCDGIVDIGDVVYLINYLYREGLSPSC